MDQLICASLSIPPVDVLELLIRTRTAVGCLVDSDMHVADDGFSGYLSMYGQHYLQ